MEKLSALLSTINKPWTFFLYFSELGLKHLLSGLLNLVGSNSLRRYFHFRVNKTIFNAFVP